MPLFGKKPTPAKSAAPPASVKTASKPSTVSTTAARDGAPSAPVTAALPTVSLPPKPDASADPVAYLRSLYAVRERAEQVFARRRDLKHFTYNEAALASVVKFVLAIIKRDYGQDYNSIPPHGRWQHFEVGGRPRVDDLIKTWGPSVDPTERARRVIDLFVVSVLLDAGAGNKWTYKSRASGRIYRRSEGIAVASIEMFADGLFSSDASNRSQVDAQALEQLTSDKMTAGLQVTAQNPMSGVEGRASLLQRLGSALRKQPDIFGVDGRPGNLVDYLRKHASAQQAPSGVTVIPLPILWTVLLDGLESIWPAGRTQLNGQVLGDAWPCSTLPQQDPPHLGIQPFHKLTQWLTYSVVQALVRVGNFSFAGTELLTGLPEYRNGGLFIDLGVLTLKANDIERGEMRFRDSAAHGGQSVEVIPTFDAGDDVVVEWRAMTVCLLDRVHAEINRQLGLTGTPRALTLPQVLEAGTWKAGREIAEVQRPNAKGSPLGIVSDGTVF
ncbi:hypothetical protein PYCC9005_000341 [Savitreella phatthalungensis]